MNIRNASITSFVKEYLATYTLIVLGVLLVYGNSLTGAFLTADDISGIVENSAIKDIEIALATYNVETILNATTHLLFGMNPIAFHAKALLFHSINGLLVYAFSKLLFDKKIAWIATAVFLAHPINAEAVAWISGSPHVFGRMWALATLVLYVAYKRLESMRYLIGASIVYLLYLVGLRTPWAFVVPFLIVGLDYAFFKSRPFVRRLKEYAWFFAPAILYLLIYFPLQLRDRVGDAIFFNPTNVDTPPLLISWGITIQRSVILFLYPISLSIYNPLFYTNFISYTWLILSAFFVGGLIFIFWEKKKIVGLIACIYLAVLPSFLPSGATGIHIAERYFYLSSVFFALLLAYGLVKIESMYKIKRFALIGAMIITSLYSIRTFVRTDDWSSSKALWTATQKTAPNNYKVHTDLGNVYLAEGDLQTALIHYQRSLELQPNFYPAVTNIGIVFIQTGNPEQALPFLARALELDPAPFMPLYGLGLIAYSEGDTVLAKQYLEQSLAINPDFPLARNALNQLAF